MKEKQLIMRLNKDNVYVLTEIKEVSKTIIIDHVTEVPEHVNYRCNTDFSGPTVGEAQDEAMRNKNSPWFNLSEKEVKEVKEYLNKLSKFKGY